MIFALFEQASQALTTEYTEESQNQKTLDAMSFPKN